MIDWKCGDCGKEYSHEEFIKLDKIKAVEDEDNPMENHGFHSKCVCGYVFGKDRWHLVGTVDIGGAKIRASTVFLELGAFNGEWYETMLFVDETQEDAELNVDYLERYITKEEAEKGHEKVLGLLKGEEFTIMPITWELKINNGENPQ